MIPATLSAPRATFSFFRGATAAAPLADPDHQDYALLLAGIEGLMDRCTARDLDLHFEASRRAARALRVQQRVGSRPALPAQLLSDLCHEIAQYVDAPVRQAAVRCLRRAAANRAGA